MTQVVSHVCIFRAKFTQWGKSCIPIVKSELPTPRCLSLCGSLFMYYARAPLLVGYHTAEILGYPRRPELTLFSWAPVLLSFVPLASLTLHEIPFPSIFLPPKCLLPSFIEFPIISPHNGSPHLPYTVCFPFRKAIP